MSMNTGKTKLHKPEPFYSAYSTKLKMPITFQENSPWTDQSQKADADINTIMARYQSTGELPVINAAEANFLDVSEMDFRTHMDAVREANAMFAQLPSKIRDRFGNDPGAFLGFVEDEDNLPEIAKLGLLTQEATQKILYPNQPLTDEDA
ncbi:MAG: internal scaffolding protein [Microviridae sp.]|nr:MAG: internal scaffolding protein [Microviridae sp.]